MARPMRIEFENACYHVMNRGAGHKTIYKNALHKRIFLTLLEEATILFNIEIHAYCLMSNHYHLLIKTPFANLSRAMRHINGVYTQLFNKNEKTDGSLFRGRYKAIIVSYEEYFLNVNRYIHLNPVSAGITHLPENYKWSSYQYYLHSKNKPSWLNIEETLNLFQQNTEAFSLFTQDGLDEKTISFYKTNSKIFGSKIFIDTLLKKISEDKISAVKTDYNSTRPILSINEIITLCSTFFEIGRNLLVKKIRGKTNDQRKITIYICRLWSQETLTNIAKNFNCKSTTTISDAISYIKNRIKIDNTLNDIINKIYHEVLKYSQTNT